MKNINFLLILFLIFSFTKKMNSQENTLEVVNRVNIEKYSGLWYEIAKIPNSFQDHCAYGTTAEYRLNEDREIEVINRCYEEDGELDVAEGIAKVVDEKTNAKLEVSFVKILWFNLFWGDYWIIGLDDNYQWAIVGHPERKYGWILSRTPKMKQETLDIIFDILKETGYNPDDFVFTTHK